MSDDPKIILQEAIARLTEFNAENGAVNSISLQKTIGLVSSYFASKLLDKKQQPKSWKDVKRAIDVLKSHYLLIQKLSEGSCQEQKLAASAVAAIEQYNLIIDKVRQTPKNLNERINHFLLQQNGHFLPAELSKIHLPKKYSLSIQYTEKGQVGDQKRFSSKMVNQHAVAAVRKICQLNSGMLKATPFSQTAPSHLSRQAVELFHMKAISLVEQHGQLSKQEARAALRKAHLQSYIEPDFSQCYVSCSFSATPGQMICISGIFEKSPLDKEGKEKLFTLPKYESFQLTLTPTHTGFPYPMEYTGWALPDLVPPYPHCLEELPLLKPLYHSKLAVAQHLHPKGNLVDKAKRNYEHKKQEIMSHKEEYLALQKELSLAIAVAASPQGISSEVKETIENFFVTINQVDHFFEYYAETQQIINEMFMSRPFAKLEAAQLEKNPPNTPLAILEGEVKKAKFELEQQKTQGCSELEKKTLYYILQMGSILAAPCHRIFLQHFSELRFAPPMLDDFEQKLQLATYRQLTTFIRELESEKVPAFDEIARQIQNDCHLFQASSFEAIESKDPAADYVNELETYFNSRYYATLN